MLLFVAKTVPLLCLSTGVVAKTLPSLAVLRRSCPKHGCCFPKSGDQEVSHRLIAPCSYPANTTVTMPTPPNA